uniref:WAP domain-containing protein n=1 Tax=Monodelphis domestica TaxID=13616 RepID=A0A5F8HE65_MONDO
KEGSGSLVLVLLRKIQTLSYIGKLGTCPEIVYQCTREPPPDKCQRDRDCPGTFRCCPHFCGKKCLDALNPNLPVFAKETGECPPDPYRCIREESPQCANDSNCLQNKKCCYFHCGFKCVDPSNLSTINPFPLYL